MELSELLIGVKIEPEKVHTILRVTSDHCVNWLHAQMKNVQSAKAVLVLDDVTGFWGESDYLEFAHPYLKKIFDSFPEMLHLFHNDTDSDVCFPHITDTGAHLFNFTHKKNIGLVREKVGGNVGLMGNVPPMALVRETLETVRAPTKDVVADYRNANDGSCAGLFVSPGGGVPMGAARENIAAMIEAARDE